MPRSARQPRWAKRAVRRAGLADPSAAAEGVRSEVGRSLDKVESWSRHSAARSRWAASAAANTLAVGPWCHLEGFALEPSSKAGPDGAAWGDADTHSGAEVDVLGDVYNRRLWRHALHPLRGGSGGLGALARGPGGRRNPR